MRRSAKALVALSLLVMLPGCASIVSGSSDDVEVVTNPPGADCTLYRKGSNIGRIDPTPGVARVSRSYSDIDVSCVKDGYDETHGTNASGFNGWVIGNLLFGGLVGIIIDTSNANATGYEETTVVSLLPKPQAPKPEPPTEPTGKEQPDVHTSMTGDYVSTDGSPNQADQSGGDLSKSSY